MTAAATGADDGSVWTTIGGGTSIISGGRTNCGGFQEMTVNFLANRPGLSLFHRHMYHHMDFGFMGLLSAH